MKFEIRKIINEDNPRVKEVLVSVMKEFDVPENGTALSDPESVSYTHLTLPTIYSV